MPALFRLQYQSNNSHMEQRSSVHPSIQLLIKSTVLMHRNLLLATVQMGVLRLKLFVFIIPTVPLHILDPSESTLLSHLCIDLLPGFLMSVIISIIQIYPFMNESVLVQQPIF